MLGADGGRGRVGGGWGGRGCAGGDIGLTFGRVELAGSRGCVISPDLHGKAAVKTLS